MVTKEAGANTVRVCAEVIEVTGQLKDQYPEIEISIVDNQADFISGAIAQVRQALILGGILAFIVLFFFLHDLRNPVNIAISMPVSVVTTFALMYFSGASRLVLKGPAWRCRRPLSKARAKSAWRSPPQP